MKHLLMTGSLLFGGLSSQAVEESYCFDFDGSTGITFTEPVTYQPESMSIEAWIKPDATNGGRTIVNWNTGGANALFRLSNGKLQFGQWNGSSWQNVITDATIPTGVWTHVALVRDSGTVQLYINGVADGNSVNITNNISPTRFDIGIQVNKEYFDGQIDELRLWTRVLTVEEINEAMHLSVDGDAPGLEAYWKLNSQSGDTVYDYTGAEKTGTVAGTSQWVVSRAPIIEYQEGNAGPPASGTGPVEIGKVVLSLPECLDADTLTSTRYQGLTVSTDTMVAEEYAITAQHSITPGITDRDLAAIPEMQVRSLKTWYIRSENNQAFSLEFYLEEGVPKGEATDFTLIHRDHTTGSFTYAGGDRASSQAAEVNRLNSTVTFTGMSLTDGFYTLATANDTLSPVLGLRTHLADGVLSWQVDAEVNVSHYLVERFENGQWLTEQEVVAGPGSYTVAVQNPQGSYRIATVDHTGFTQHFAVGSSDVWVDIQLQPGWNLLSLPFVQEDLERALGEVNSEKLWVWDGQGYLASETVEPLQGFWVYSSAPQALSVCGQLTEQPRARTMGWNLIGVADNQEAPQNATIFGWSESYQQLLERDNLLVPGVGYWWFEQP